jgi:hypothetical protein
MSLLSTLLTKRGIDTIEELAPEEKATFERWSVVLTGETVTIDSIKEFCKSQIRKVEETIDGKSPLTPLQTACLYVYIQLLKAIEAPEQERAALERHLTDLINS